MFKRLKHIDFPEMQEYSLNTDTRMGIYFEMTDPAKTERQACQDDRRRRKA